MRLWLILILALASLCGDAVAQNIAIADATVYPSQGATLKTHTTILIHAGKIAGIGSKLRIPRRERMPMPPASGRLPPIKISSRSGKTPIPIFPS